MKKLKFLGFLFLVGLLSMASCSKDDDNKDNNNVPEGKITGTVDGKNVEFISNAVSYTATDSGKQYKYVVISGTTGTYGQAGYASFVITVYAENLEQKTYPVPVFNENFKYDFFKGYAMGWYMTSNKTYTSYQIKGSAGSVTIESLSDTNVKGSYDMTLANTVQSNQTTDSIQMKGSFNAKIVQVIVEQ